MRVVKDGDRTAGESKKRGWQGEWKDAACGAGGRRKRGGRRGAGHSASGNAVRFR
jgi:hypothetical protein